MLIVISEDMRANQFLGNHRIYIVIHHCSEKEIFFSIFIFPYTWFVYSVKIRFKTGFIWRYRYSLFVLRIQNTVGTFVVRNSFNQIFTRLVLKCYCYIVIVVITS